MAAEKLTKGRLTQLLVTFSVLIAAFVWRTIDDPNRNRYEDVACSDSKVCAIAFEGEKYRLTINGSTVNIQPVLATNVKTDTYVVYRQKNYSITDTIELESIEKQSLVMTNGSASVTIIVTTL